MRAEDFQAEKNESSKSDENETQKNFNAENANDQKFNKKNEINHIFEEENKSFLKIKRYRDPQELDISMHTIKRDIKVKFDF